MAEFVSDDDREGDASASPLRSGSTDWELILSTSSSPVLQSGDELSGSDVSGVHGLSLPGPAFEPDRLVHDDYFCFEAGNSDISPNSFSIGGDVCESSAQGEGTGLSWDSHDDDNPQITASPLPAASDSGLVDASSPRPVVVERDTDVSPSIAEPESCAEDTRNHAGLQLPREFYRDDPALQSFSLPGPSTDYTKPGSPSSSSTPRSDIDKSGEQAIYHHGLSFLSDEGEQPVVANGTGTSDLVVGDGNARDDIGGSPRLEGGSNHGDNPRSEGGTNHRRENPSCDCWLQRQLCLWQARVGRAKTLCSVTLAAAIVGILILGRGWQRLRAQNRTLLLQLRAKDKKITQLMFQLLQMKESLSKTRQIPVIRAKPSLQIPQDRS